MKKLYIFGFLTILSSCGGGGGGGGGGDVPTPPTPAPGITFSASPTSVLLNSSSTFSWSTTNATSCTASGSNNWTGTKATSGTEDVSIDIAGDTIYTLSCSGAGGTRNASVTVEGYRQTDGVVVDGYISGADVFIDENENFIADASENSTTSDNDGKFTIKYANGSLVSIGGTDLDSQTLLDNLLITHKLDGHSEFKAVTPVTSVEAFMEVGSNINSALGIDLSIDISVTDPVALKGDGGIYDYLYEKGNQLTILAYALQNITNDLNTTTETTQDYFKAIAEEVEKEFNETSLKVDIETETFINKTFENVITAKSVTIDNTAKENTVKALSGVLPIVEVKASDDLTTSVIRFAVSTLQEDIKAVANGSASAEKVASYTTNVIDYIAKDQNINSDDITPDISAIDDSTVTAEDTPVTVQVLANDSYISTAPISITATNGNNGTVEVAESSPDQITYSPNTDYNGSDTFSYTITQGDKVAMADVNVTITPVNDAPSIDIASIIQVAENQTAVTTISVSDVDEDELTLTLGGTDADSFNLSNNNVLSFKEAPDYETKTSYSIALSLTDGTETVTKDVTIAITNVNDVAPEFTSDATFSAAENQTAIGTVTTTDAEGDDVTFTVSGSELAITSAGVLTFVEAPDYETKTSYTATVTASDGLNTTTQDITVNVTNVNDVAPEFTSEATFSAAENQTTIGTVTATDAEGDDVTFTISGDELAITSAGVLTFVEAPDYETKATYTSTVTASDGTNSTTQDITVNVTNVNDNNPSFTSEATFSSAENQTSIGTVTATDADGDGVTYLISGSEITINSSSGVIAFVLAPDYETKATYTATVTASDGTNSTTQDITVNVTNVNDIAPVFTSSNNFSVVEGQTAIGTVTATDADGDGDDVTFTVSGTELAVTSDGVLTFISAPDYETKSSYTATVTASDGLNQTNQNITISITYNHVYPDHWDQHQTNLNKIKNEYTNPIGFNLDKVWFTTFNINKDKFSTTRFDYFLEDPYFQGDVGVNTWFTEGDATYYFNCNWVPRVPSEGATKIFKYVNGEFNKLIYQKNEGCNHPFSIKNKDGSFQHIFLGLDEGKLGTGSQALGDTYTFNTQSGEFTNLNFSIGSHGQHVFDYQQDGDEDIISNDFGNIVASGNPFILRNDGENNFSVVMIPQPDFIETGRLRYGTMSAAAFYESGYLKVVYTDFDVSKELDNRWGIEAEKNVVVTYEPNDLTVVDVTQLPDPYSEKNFVNLEYYNQSWIGSNGLSHDVRSTPIDIDYDGDIDIVIGSQVYGENISLPQILINNNGVFEDQTESRLFNWVFATGSIHRWDFADVNGDGYLDIITKDGCNNLLESSDGELIAIRPNGCELKVAVNDGTGHFISIIEPTHILQIFEGNEFKQGRILPIFGMDQNRNLSWVYADGKECNGCYNEGNHEIFTVKLDGILSTGPNGMDPAIRGEPGFNEFYYLLHHADARDAVSSGKYDNGLEHYIAIGKDLGYSPNAKSSTNVTVDSYSINPVHTVKSKYVNLVPSITSSATFSAAENQTGIGTVTATDAEGDDITFTVSGTELEITSAGVLTFASAPDYETKTSYTATVTATDGVNSVSQIITVNIIEAETNKPTVSDFTLSPREVNVSDNTAQVTYTIRIIDPSGIKRTYPGQWKRAGDASFGAGQLELISGDKFDGIWQSVTTFPTYLKSGDYPIINIRVEDEWDNHITFSSTLNVNVVNNNAESIPPEASELSVSPREVNVSDNTAQVTYTIRIIDPSGIKRTYPGQWKRAGDASFGAGQLELISGDKFDGIWQSVTTFPTYLKSGDYAIINIRAEDEWANPVEVSSSSNDHYVNVVNDNAESIPPEVSDLSVSPPLVDLANGSATVKYTVRVKDSSGIKIIYPGQWKRAGDASFGAGQLELISGDKFDGIWQSVTTFPSTLKPGDYGITNIRAEDEWTNFTIASSSSSDHYVNVVNKIFNNPPVISSGSIYSLEENKLYIGSVTASDDDGDALTFSVSNSELTINSSGELSFINPPDYETKSTYTSKVTVSDSLNSAEKNITINITDVDELSTASDCNYVINDASNNEFRYCWEESQSTSGTEYSANIVKPLTITFADESIEIPNISYAEKLYIDYGVILESTSLDWTNDQAYAIYQTLKKIPQNIRNEANDRRVFSKWALTDLQIQDDISFDKSSNNISVTIETSVFENANPRIATVDGKKGIYFSNKLHNALVRYVTDGGNDVSAVNKILVERYGVTTDIDDYAALTGEQATRFQAFQAEELVAIISMFEEMPSGYHKIDGLNHLVRRINGAVNPYYPEAPAIAWDSSGYIEFMETAFNTVSIDYLHRLILHEKAHFLWAKIFDDELKNDWIELGGWYECSEKESGWCTTKQTEFVSAYAHLKNPNEDMAESLSYFIINPDALKSRSLGKYEFVRDRIMQGNIYISQIQENLTFTVYNLYPDYVFPGKVKKLLVSVDGEPTEDKTVTVEIQLHALDKILEGAAWARMRIFSTADTYFDLYLYPQNGQNLDTTLRGTYTLSKYAKSGFWKTSQLVLSDEVGNLRMEGANDFGWRMYVNNPDEDLDKPLYIADSMSLTKSLTTIENQEVDVITALWDIDEAFPRENQGCYGALNDENPSTYSLQKYSPQTYSGNYEAGKCLLEYVMPSYMPSGMYRLNYIRMIDEAGNESRNYFATPSGVDTGDNFAGDQLDELAKEVFLETSNPDITAPELDLNNLSISATPTNPNNPNGETIVKFTFRVKDDISGYKLGYYKFRDPQGLTSGYYHYPERRSEIFPSAEDLDWYEYTSTVVLPAGSAPGTWGVVELTLRDRALNFKTYNFTEIISFQTE